MSKTHVPLDQVRDNPHQSRLDIGDVEALAETILQHGLRQLPEARLVVDGEQPTYSKYTHNKDGEWYVIDDGYATAELASGHRRVEAIRQLNLDDTVTDGDLRDVGLTPGYVPVDLQRLCDEEMLDLLTIENAQREELSPIEEARLIGEMVDAGRDAAQIAERFGKSPSWVSNRKRLTTLPVYVQEHVHDGKISVRQGMALATAFAVEDEHPELVEQVNVGLKPGTMAGKAMRGHLTSDDIRDRTDELIGVVERVEEQRSSSLQDLPCAFCGAEVGEPCKTRDGDTADTHRAREKALAAKEAGVLEYGEVSAERLRSLIEPASTQVDYNSDEYSLADLVAAHQILRGYETGSARSGHNARARKLRKEMRRRVDVDGEVGLDAEEVVHTAPKELRDRVEGLRTIALPVAVNRAANNSSSRSENQTFQTDDSREAREEDPQGDGGPASSALSKADADSGERGREGSSSRSQQDVEGGEARRAERERGNAEGAASRIVLVACSKSKLNTPAHAQVLYKGQLFKKSKAYARQLVEDGEADAWYILSAKHGLVEPREMIDPYDETLTNASVEEKREWGKQVNLKLGEVAPTYHTPVTHIILGGKDYYEPIRSFYENVHDVKRRTFTAPFEGMVGNGEMMQWLDERLEEEDLAASDAEMSGDGTPSSDSSTDHPAHLPMVIDAAEADGHDWELQSLDEGHYEGIVQNGGTAHIAEGATPAEALQAAWHRAQDVPAGEIGSVNEPEVDRLLSAAGTEMWDDQAAGEASIASLLVAHRVAGERQETWRTKLIAEAVEERAGRVTGDDVPEDVLEEVQAEVERRLEPVEA